MLPTQSTRLNKYISESGICSRREADRYIEQGNVFLNGKRATIGDQVVPGDVVKVNGQVIEPRDAEDLVFIALNKPVGIVSTTEDGERDNIVDFVNHSSRIMNVSLSGIPLGEWRDLTDDELIELFKLIENSSSEAKPKAKAKPKTQAIKRPVVKAPQAEEKGRGKPGNGKRFTQPGRKKKGR